MSDRVRTIQDLYDDLASAQTVADMRAVLDRETAYQAAELNPRDVARANIRWVAGYGSEDVQKRAMRLLAGVSAAIQAPKRLTEAETLLTALRGCNEHARGQGWGSFPVTDEFASELVTHFGELLAHVGVLQADNQRLRDELELAKARGRSCHSFEPDGNQSTLCNLCGEKEEAHRG